MMYRMFLDERATLTLDRAAFIIGEYPPILITVEEEQRMSNGGFTLTVRRNRDMPGF